MTHRPDPRRLAWLAAAAAILTLAPGASGQTPRDHWVCAWTTAVIGRPPYPPAAADGGAGRGAAQPPRLPFPANQTLREIVHVSLGGTRARIVLTNVFGTAPLKVGAAHVAVHGNDAAIVAGSDRALTFGGRDEVTIPAGAVVVSDPATVTFPAFADLAVDLFIPDSTENQTVTVHRSAYQTSYLAPGNRAGAADLGDATKVATWYFLADVEVSTADRAPVVVTFGDSITDGAGSTIDGNRRWPDVFAKRLAGPDKRARVAVLNTGIGGNRLLREQIPEFGVNALARFDRDVLSHPGVTHVVVLEGINDIGMAGGSEAPTAAELIAAQKQIIERARSHGLKVIGATLTPFEGAAYYTEIGEAKRQAMNEWIRRGNVFDGVIDFDAAVRDPQAPKRFAAAYDRGDHLHLSDAGYEAMANAINLGLFK